VGGVASPILANIYLDRLDRYVTETLLPQYNRGEGRADNPLYVALGRSIASAKKKGQKDLYKELVAQRRQLPSGDPTDPNYRRLRYVRYADDFLLGFAGPRSEAEEIKQHLQRYLWSALKLELSSTKTLITHATTETARFLGYEIGVSHCDTKLTNQVRSVNGAVHLRVPLDKIADKCARYMAHGKAVHRPERRNDSDYSIIAQYQAEYGGVVQYYLLAHNVASLRHLQYIMQTSLVKTLAAKHKMSVPQVMAKYQTSVTTPYGTMKCLQVVIPREGKPPLVATFGGIPLRRKKIAVLVDTSGTLPTWRRTDVVKRLLADKCEICGAPGDCEVHHIRKLADIHRAGRREKPAWMQHMIAMRRKTLVVCHACHRAIHAGRPLTHDVSLESRVP